MAQRISRAKRPCASRGRPSSCPRATTSATGCGAPSPSCTSSSTRATRRAPALHLTRTDRSGGGHPAGPPGHRLLPDDPEAIGPARPDAPARRTAAGARHGVRGPGDPRRPGPHALGPRPRRRGHRPARLDDRRRSRARRVPAAGGHRCGAHRAPTAADTDWPQVLALYGLLEQVAPSPFVTLARAVGLAEAEGPDAAAPLLADLDHSWASTSGGTPSAATSRSCAATRRTPAATTSPRRQERRTSPSNAT